MAGVGNDPREDRYFNIGRQADMYDKQGEFVKLWIPELANIPSEKVHFVGLLSDEEQKKYSVILGKDYPKPIINIGKWIKS